MLLEVAVIIIALTYTAKTFLVCGIAWRLYKNTDRSLVLALKQYLIKRSGNYVVDNKTGLLEFGEPNE